MHRNTRFPVSGNIQYCSSLHWRFAVKFLSCGPDDCILGKQSDPDFIKPTNIDSESIFIAVDALISKDFIEDIKSNVLENPSTIIVSNNSRVSPIGAFQSLENWGKNDAKSNKKIGPLGIGVLSSVLNYSTIDFPSIPDNIAICGGGFVKKFDSFGAFPFSDQHDLAEFANKLSLDVNVIGLYPGQSFSYEDSIIQIGEAHWITLNEKKHNNLKSELTDFISMGKRIDLCASVSKSYSNIGEFKENLEEAVSEINRSAKDLILSISGRHAISMDTHRGHILGPRRIAYIFRDDNLGIRVCYGLNILSGKFEVEEVIDEQLLYDRYPFGVEFPLSDFLAMIKGELQIWDIVGVSIRSWFEKGIFDGLIPFLYCYYGENGAPDLFSKLINKKLKSIGYVCA